MPSSSRSSPTSLSLEAKRSRFRSEHVSRLAVSPGPQSLQQKAPPKRGQGSEEAAWLSNGVRHAVEGRVEVRADELHGGDDDYRNAGCDETILDRRRAGLVLEETCEKLHHWVGLPWICGGKATKSSRRKRFGFR